MADFPTIQAQLNDLPQTFKRIGAPYTQIIDALTGGLFGHAQAGDALETQVISFFAAMFAWADTWGAVFGFPRRSNEADSVYLKRIQNMLLAFHVSPVAMLTWLQVIEQITNPQLNENLPNVGYSINLNASLSPAQINLIIANLAYVRPAGVPINLTQQSGGTYLGTVNYFGAPRTTGAYLAAATTTLLATIGPSTNNSLPQLPDLVLTDPTLNPSLSH